MSTIKHSDSDTVIGSQTFSYTPEVMSYVLQQRRHTYINYDVNRLVNVCLSSLVLGPLSLVLVSPPFYFPAHTNVSYYYYNGYTICPSFAVNMVPIR